MLWLCVAFFAIFQHGPMPLYSTRTLAVAWEMWDRGQFLVPHINGEPYSHKVPLLFWLIHAGWAATGVNDVWPRVLQVLIGATWLVAAAALARRVFALRPAVGRMAPWFLIALAYSFLFGLQIMYEVLLAACVAGAMLALTGRPRWTWFALAVGAGLMTKGPVALLHVAFPFLLGPWWSEHARADRRGWYLRGGLALLAAFALLVAWAVPAGFAGGEEYRNQLFFSQTAGRVVQSFDHARPLWWYLPMLGALLFPWIGWPRLWRAVATWRRPLGDGERFLIAWLVPTFAVFCLISGKQVYYLLPLLPGVAMAMARAVSRQQQTDGGHGWRWSAWPLAVTALLFALYLAALPFLRDSGHLHSHWLHDVARYSPWFAVGFGVLGGVLLLPGEGETELHRIAGATLLGVGLAHALFAHTLFHNFNLNPAADRLARAAAEGRPIANVGPYEGQFHFRARLRIHIEDITVHQIGEWARTHPRGLIVQYPAKIRPQARRYADLIQPFRNRWLEIWQADALAAVEAGRTPADPPRTTALHPPDYWRFGPPPSRE
ncbi:glycosyl transferase [Tahibacter amnicola]|uniref:Glycosyl transferase n=2 Tax=Tahibacter amnicola TaxID=2976241 RepID=A0ABY6BSI9_9GAMM|nr:glycosyl transferase [Tahibacter amnicola]UXI70752.1 glycosyl transferase [Tahibacter amnicola]